MDIHEEKISRLLRLKRYEQPGQEYFDSFLSEFQARQRAEVLKRPLRQLVWERVCSIVSSFEVPRLAYAATVVAAVLAVSVIASRPSVSAKVDGSERETLSLVSSQPVSIGATRPVSLTASGSPSVHYVLPTRPVSYASARSF